MDSGEIVVSSIRAGMKREFAMMMKAQSEMGALPGSSKQKEKLGRRVLSVPARATCEVLTRLVGR
ncbi:UNVERIFIED_CONTAM: hypothetical protein Slati_3432000 [Sesamum latifolium]|uniref:Uncharacterized protein n=1 Tax=Sesamum latifolium TaxID=2727402 RepID=A0AAW2UF43_9LAMI